MKGKKRERQKNKGLKRTLALALAVFVLLSLTEAPRILASSGNSTEPHSGAVAEQSAAEVRDQTAGTQDGAAGTPGGTEGGQAADEETEENDRQAGSSGNVQDEEQADGGGTDGGIVEYLPQALPEGLTVKAWTDAGVLPEDVYLEVEQLPGEDQNSRYAEALRASGTDADGFMLWDIGFYDAAGERVEPAGGSVHLEIACSGLNISEMDTASLSLRQMAETESGIAVQSVADTSESLSGNIAVDGETVHAAFTAESLSVFALTWSCNPEGGTARALGSVRAARPTAQMRAGHEKYVEKKEDGTYDLTLTVSGMAGTATSKAELDVVYVLDKSGSMNDGLGGGSRKTRREAAKDAIDSLTAALASNQNIDVRFSLVTFSGSDGRWDRAWNDSEVAVDWTGDTRRITSSSGPSANGGTNYQAGLRNAKELLASARSGALTAVIFISDGNPTFRYDENGYTTGTGSSDLLGYNLQAAKDEAAGLGTNYFYTVGVGPKNNYSKLRDLKDAAPENTTKAFYEGTDEASLNAAFDDIQAAITTMLCSDVTIADTLSGHVQLTGIAAGNPASMTVAVRDGEGNVVVSGENSVEFEGVTITARYDESTRQVILDFPDDYELKGGYTYQVTVNIEPSEAAYEAYRNNGAAYTDTGEPGTGPASEGQQGFFSNSDSSLTYTYNGEQINDSYNRPVVQLEPGTLVIEKRIEGLEGEALDYLRQNLKFNYTLNNGSLQEVPFSEFTWNQESGSYQYRIEGLSPDTVYQAGEVNADISSVYNYLLTASSQNSQGTVERLETKTASFANTYEPGSHVLTIEKRVSGSMGDHNREFSFSLALARDGQAYTEDLIYTENENSGEKTLRADKGVYQFSLADGDEIHLTIPHGCAYTVVEENADYMLQVEPGGGVYSEGKLTGTLNEDSAAVFTNTKEMVPPTGIGWPVLPYLAMVLLALASATAFRMRRREG